VTIPHGVRRLLALVVATCLLTALTATPTQASLTLLTCTGRVEINYSPGLTYTEQTVAVGGQDTAEVCTSLTHPQLHSFVGPFTGTGQRSCLDLLAEGSGTQTLYWNGSTTTTSHWEWTGHPTQTGSLLIVVTTGPITSGTLAGATLTQELIVTADTLNACTQPGGLTQLHGPSTWEFTDL
jgi:hypothetical protein